MSHLSYRRDSSVCRLGCTEQFRAIAVAQLTYRESLRDIETCWWASLAKFYSKGFRSPITLSTLADGNEVRDSHI
jgi:hypothetical protein